MKNDRLTIETLHAADMALLQPLVNEFVQTHPSLSFREDPWGTFRNWFARGLDNVDFQCLIAKTQGDIVGFIAGDIRENGPLLSPDRIGHVSVLVVGGRSRMSGIGDALWKEMRRWFESKGINYFELYTEHGNKLSGPFWNKRGFEIFLEKRRLV